MPDEQKEQIAKLESTITELKNRLAAVTSINRGRACLYCAQKDLAADGGKKDGA